jgi:hypothetical protein
MMVTFSSWNLMHMALLLKKAGGIPAWGNMAEAWEKGERFDHPAIGNEDTGEA